MRTRAYASADKPALQPLPIDPKQDHIRVLARIAGGRPVRKEVQDQIEHLRRLLTDGPLDQWSIQMLLGVTMARAKHLLQKLRASNVIESVDGKWRMKAQPSVLA